MMYHLISALTEFIFHTSIIKQTYLQCLLFIIINVFQRLTFDKERVQMYLLISPNCAFTTWNIRERTSMADVQSNVCTAQWTGYSFKVLQLVYTMLWMHLHYFWDSTNLPGGLGLFFSRCTICAIGCFQRSTHSQWWGTRARACGENF